jgi:hypothetical protein
MSIGPEATSKSLMDFLESLLGKEDDEVLFAIAEELGSVW